ncbi:MAG: Glyoxalase/bleomycin resistance protein/dioxygenase, partial [Bryobacterales bacterium]|nr:Glyoxalase/bleomycin resistance protein/dioxygenase [Bryobacterales bacterium]
MPAIESYAPGSFCWAELATSDAEAAKQFYSQMFGWTWTDSPTPGGVYTTFEVDGNPAAAVYAGQPGVPSHWAVYFTAENVDETAAKVAALGGKLVMAPFDVMEHGRMAIVQDSQGASFCLWQAFLHIGATHPGPFNKTVWPELHTPDPAAAAAFYSGLFRWKTKPETGVESAQYVEWINGESAFGGLMPMRGDEWKGVPPHWMIYITVADCDER